MCTVSVVAGGDRLRVMCNRDERHTRPDAHPPTIVRTPAGLAVLPRDPQGGGTWIAATSAGIVFATLNASGSRPAVGPSRGLVILDLLDAVGFDDAVHRARALCRHGWPPHRLLVVAERRLAVVSSNRDDYGVTTRGLDTPLMFTSSALGDELVEPVRRRLFEEVVVAASDRLDGQDAFHRHRWPERPHLSVHMRRHDAATQSITTVEVSPAQAAMRYESVREIAGEPAWLSIPRAAPAGRPTAAAALALVS